MDIDAIISTYDGMSTGIIKVLKKYNLNKKILVTGQDAELAACAHLLTGDQTITIYKPGYKLAHKAVEFAYKMALNDELKVDKHIYNGRIEVPTILLDPILLDKNNLKTVIIKDGVFTLEQINSLTESEEEGL